MKITLIYISLLTIFFSCGAKEDIPLQRDSETPEVTSAKERRDNYHEQIELDFLLLENHIALIDSLLIKNALEKFELPEEESCGGNALGYKYNGYWSYIKRSKELENGYSIQEFYLKDSIVFLIRNTINTINIANSSSINDLLLAYDKEVQIITFDPIEEMTVLKNGKEI